MPSSGTHVVRCSCCRRKRRAPSSPTASAAAAESIGRIQQHRMRGLTLDPTSSDALPAMGSEHSTGCGCADRRLVHQHQQHVVRRALSCPMNARLQRIGHRAALLQVHHARAAEQVSLLRSEGAQHLIGSVPENKEGLCSCIMGGLHRQAREGASVPAQQGLRQPAEPPPCPCGEYDGDSPSHSQALVRSHRLQDAAVPRSAAVDRPRAGRQGLPQVIGGVVLGPEDLSEHRNGAFGGRLGPDVEAQR